MGSNALHLRFSALSDVGKKRAHNEDAFCTLLDANFFAVADGMGGHAGGEVASNMAIESISEIVTRNQKLFQRHLESVSNVEENPIAQILSGALRQASREIFRRAAKDPALRGMGTTSTCLLIDHENVFVGHVGDSRCYLLRGGQLIQLTEDHTLINEQLRAGLITTEQAKSSRFRNIITRSIGFEEDVDVDMIALRAQPNDVFVLCTDGLTGLVQDEEMSDILEKNELETAVNKLVELANFRGGDDNITVVLIKIV